MIAWSPGVSLEDMEEKIIRKAYSFYNKNVEATSKCLKIGIAELEEKIKLFAIKEQEVKETVEKEKKKYAEFLRRSRGNLKATPVYREIPDYEPSFPMAGEEKMRKNLSNA